MKFRGRVQGIEGDSIVGWCLATDAPRRPQFISVFDGDQVVGAIGANRYRSDLLQMGGNGYHGFSFPIPERFRDGVARVLSVFAGASTEELDGSPVRVRLDRNSSKRDSKKPAAVVCWDLAHNPVGRAFRLCELLKPNWNVELIGPIWRRFGTALWAPLRNESMVVKSFHPSNLIDVWREGARLALLQSYDLVIVCKPRLPGLLVGLQIAEQSCCPLIIDIDENDRAFTKTRGRQSDHQELIEEPFGKIGTHMAYEHLHVADAMTVSSPILQQYFPGRVVRHARDEGAPSADRQLARSRFGFTDKDFVIAFIGTARAHKGLSHVLAALKEIADPTIRLLLAGSIDFQVQREIKASGLGNQVIAHEELDLAGFGSIEFANFVASADLVPVLQDLDSEISKTQIPAKLTDALQYGVRIVGTDAPPLRDLAARGVVDIIKTGQFANYLGKIRSEPPLKTSADHRRRVFEEEFSFAINRPRLQLAVNEALASFDPKRARVSHAIRELLAKTRAACVAEKGIGAVPQRSRSRKRDRLLDIAFFWKQNDSSLFGRRSDMVVKYLLKSERVGQIVHFDNMITISDLRRMARAKVEKPLGVAAMQFGQTVSRALALSDQPSLTQRLFLLLSEKSNFGSFAGTTLNCRDQYAEFVERALRERGMDPARTIAWVCPIVQGFAEVNEQVKFRKIVADLIDDQRTWQHSDDERANLHRLYETTLRRSDLVFTNCEGNRERFAWARADILVVPNGTELDHDKPSAVPEQLRGLPRPIIGYLGSLRDRIDWQLVQTLATKRPAWSLVLAGPVEHDRVPRWVKGLPNISLPGPVAYEESHSWISSFDVAVMPHERSPMTESMNPLKIYNYLAAGAPVVTTPVANLDDVSDLVLIRDTPEAFIQAIENVLSLPRAAIPKKKLQGFSWERRVSIMLDEIQRIL